LDCKRKSRLETADDSQARPPVTKADLETVKRTREILSSPGNWSRTDLKPGLCGVIEQRSGDQKSLRGSNCQAVPLFLPNLFLHRFDIAKVDPRGTLRFLRRPTCSNVFDGQHLEVRMNLLVEVYLHTAR
jgi:hypothetical protein